MREYDTINSNTNNQIELIFISISTLILQNTLRSLALLKRNESRRVSGTDTGSAVLDGLVCDGELAQIVSDHLWLDLDLIECLAVVDADNGSDHFGHDWHVAQVSLHHFRLL